MTFGWGVEDTQTYPYQVGQLLNKYNLTLPDKQYDRIEVINAGFASGITLDSYYLYLKQYGPTFQPDLVIVDLFPYNDISDLAEMTWEAVDADGSPEKIRSTIHAVKDGAMVNRKKSNWKFEIPMLRNSHLAILLMNAMERGSPDLVNKIKSLVGVSDEKEKVSTEQILTCVYAAVKERCTEGLWESFGKTKQLLSVIQTHADTQNIKIIFTIMPSPDQAIPLSQKSPEERTTLFAQIQPQTYFKDYLSSLGIETVDILPLISDKTASDFYYNQDGHLNNSGTKFVANELANYLENMKKL